MASVDFAASSAVLWDFATRSYARPGVAALCLQLQDECGVDVLLLLSAAWLASQGRQLTPAHLAVLDRACAPRRQQLIEPLRALRRAQQADPAAPAEQVAVYEALKAAELAAERRQLQELATSLAALPVAHSDDSNLLLNNLRLTAQPSALPLVQQLANLLSAPEI